MTFPVLCINLEGAKTRWTNVMKEMTTYCPQGTLIRVDAVHWKDLTRDLQDVPLTPLTRFFVLNPKQQKYSRMSHRQMDTPSSVGIMLSHIRCWRWLLDHPEHPAALIIEDDACFDHAVFPSATETVISPLLAATDEWDVVILGYYNDGNREDQLSINGVHVFTTDHFFGGHAYMITQKAASILLTHVFPIEEQSDGLILTLGQLGLLRLYLHHRSIVTQCINAFDREGGFHTGTVANRAQTVVVVRNPLDAEQDLLHLNFGSALFVIVLLLSFCLFMGWLVGRRAGVSS